MTSISVKFAPPTTRFLLPAPDAPAEPPALDELDALDDENAFPPPPQAARRRPTAPAAAAAPRRPRANPRTEVEEFRTGVALMCQVAFCVPCSARVSGGLVLPQV